MKFLILGSSAKEHALAWALSKSHILTGLYVAPGNSGTAEIAENIDSVDILDPEEVVDFCRSKKIDYCLAGHLPSLNNGVVDALKEAGIGVFGAPQKTARLETDRLFARDFMKKYSIPSPKSRVFSDFETFERYIMEQDERLVLKRNHPMTALNVFDSSSREKLLDFGKSILPNEKLLVEPFQTGYNLSILVIMDGENYTVLPPVSDYHKACDNDLGAVTNGMGAICPVPVLKESAFSRIKATIIEPVIKGMKKEKLFYKGVFFFCLHITDKETLVTSFHVRIGNPEAQVILPLLESDFGNLLKAVEKGTLDQFPLKFSSNSAVGVVIAGEGYPYFQPEPQQVKLTTLHPERKNLLFHGATHKNGDGHIYTNGGRCFTVVGIGQNIIKANSNAYKGIERVDFKGAWNRNDIGNRFFEE